MIAVTIPINLYANRGKARTEKLLDYHVSGHLARFLNLTDLLELQ
jgi:hypothetical protein